MAFPAQVAWVSEPGEGQTASAERSADRDIEGAGVIHASTLWDVSTHVRTVVCAYSRDELPASWVQVFRRCQRAFGRAELDVRVRLDPLEDLPEAFEILAVAPSLRRRAARLARGARVVTMTRETALVVTGELIAEIVRGATLRADRIRAGVPRAVLVRGGQEL